MTYSQAPLLRLFSAGKVPGESGIPKHIETVISNVFLFNDRVYKVYKDDSKFFNENFHDLSIRKERLAFSRADFEWNHQLTSEVYIRLQGVKIETSGIHFVDEYENAEELLLITKRLSSEDLLFEHLLRKDLTVTDYYQIGKQFAQREKNFVWLGDFPDESLLENMLMRHNDDVEWVKSVEEHMPSLEAEGYLTRLKELIMRVYAHDATKIRPVFDAHSFNAFYVDQTLYLFDVYSPKDAWCFGPALVNVYRFATDIFALVGEKEFRMVLRGYHEYLNSEAPSRETGQLLVIYAAIIMVPYLYMLARTNPDKQEVAVRYHNFLKSLI
jgi:aminoglycoside phosphotransferase family enzyme